MKKKITLITSILLIIALAVTFVGCSKDKTEETPTTEASEKVSTTEPTTKFEAPEIKDVPTEATTEETEASAPETTTKKSTYTGSTGSGSSGSSSSGSSGSSSKPASTTKASSSNSGGFVSAGKNEDGNEVYVNPNGVKITIDDDDVGSHSDDSVYATDPDVQDALEADKNPDAWLQ